MISSPKMVSNSDSPYIRCMMILMRWPSTWNVEGSNGSKLACKRRDESLKLYL